MDLDGQPRGPPQRGGARRRRGRDSVHVGHDGRSERRRADARQSRSRARRRPSRSSASRKTTRCWACCRCFTRSAQMANLLLPLSAGARVVFLETVNSTTLLDALQTRGITIFACVPQFFYLIHQRVTRRSREARRDAPRASSARLVGTTVWLRDRAGSIRAAALRARAPRVRTAHAAAHHGRLAVRSGDRARPLRHRAHAPQRLRPDRNVRRGHVDAAGRSLHDVGRPSPAGRDDSHRTRCGRQRGRRGRGGLRRDPDPRARS